MEVDREGDFPGIFPGHQSRRDGRWEADPLIMDDQYVVVNLRGRGLVIVTGCSHAGIVNIVRHARLLTGVETIHALVGGFHLSGPHLEPTLPTIISALKEIRPRYIMPCHCTGWSATHQIAHFLPEAFIQSSVGTTLVL